MYSITSKFNGEDTHFQWSCSLLISCKPNLPYITLTSVHKLRPLVSLPFLFEQILLVTIGKRKNLQTEGSISLSAISLTALFWKFSVAKYTMLNYIIRDVKCTRFFSFIHWLLLFKKISVRWSDWVKLIFSFHIYFLSKLDMILFSF